MQENGRAGYDGEHCEPLVFTASWELKMPLWAEIDEGQEAMQYYVESLGAKGIFFQTPLTVLKKVTGMVSTKVAIIA